MSAWTHALCDDCWRAREPARTPVRTTYPEQIPCCVCGQETASGIYIHVDPESLPCHGEHPDAGGGRTP